MFSFFKRQIPHTSRMITGAPIPQKDRAGLAVVAIMKNEGRHIADWLRFHALAGVTDFYLYDDGSTDDAVARASAVTGINLTVIPWKLTAQLIAPNTRFSRQVMAYCHAIENFGGAYRWMAFIDIDEFIVPKTAPTILDVLNGLEDYSQISLPWTMFGPNGHREPPTEPVFYAYTTRAAARKDPILNFKCIIDPCDVTEVRVHRFRSHKMGSDSANDAGVVAHYKGRGEDRFLSDVNLQLNHYYTRSLSELEEKLSKGAVSDSTLDRRNRKIREKLEIIEETAIEDSCAVRFLERHGFPDARSFTAANPG